MEMRGQLHIVSVSRVGFVLCKTDDRVSSHLPTWSRSVLCSLDALAGYFNGNIREYTAVNYYAIKPLAVMITC
jgi:hypothetical protein